ncbi:50S ribosomal protein L5 [Deferrisoma camini]|uniref:50S ribosomal protein L5 n=1 Tax=Deferrisoma camini TaxID=1035120 RepID=UPI00046D138B|nr:50S ribosomal protein L5 [Deferrisoma camini]NOY46527.1 50S ribosomal protein L5 [Deltaproteobacteria bacterium]
MARLKQRYRQEVIPHLMKKFGYANVMQVPRIEKVVVNIGAGEAKDNPKLLDQLVEDLALITGQRPVVTRARRSIANFHLRQGMPVGCRVTLRGDRMYEFLDRMINVALPRVRDFKGVSGKGFDGRGNYTLGIAEHVIFPEVDLEKVEKVKGMNVSIATTAETDEEAKELLRELGMPFRN